MAGSGVTFLLRPRAPAPAAPVARLNLDVRPAEAVDTGGVAQDFRFSPWGSRTALTWLPNGQALVFVGRQGGVRQLYIRRLDGAEARPLAGTEGAQALAASADGRWVAFWAGRAIRRVALAGGPVEYLATARDLPPAAGDPATRQWRSS